MWETKHIIKLVADGSIASEMGLEPGDKLLAINGKKIQDIFDYRYFLLDENLLVLIEKVNGEQWELEIDKDMDEDLGLEFDSGLMDDYRSCSNQCIFCFIDQMPPGMRDTLYFKDDDTRLSFLQGNYITLTNLTEHDMERIETYKLSPINISFHTTNPKLRCEMLRNRFAGDSLHKVDRFIKAGLSMNGQIVLCKGYNDGEELERTLRDLSAYWPNLKSVSVVPVGLSKYRDGLTKLSAFSREDAINVLESIEKWQNKMMKSHGSHFVHASDEWYLLADRALPSEETYDGYLQLENGVGMLRLLECEFHETLKNVAGDDRIRIVSVATGRLAAPFIKEYMDEIRQYFPNVTVKVYDIVNDFFGEQITVAGLLTGQDILNQLKGKILGEELLISGHMLKYGEEVFLDDMTVEELSRALGVPIRIVTSEGEALLDAAINRTGE